MLKLTKRTSDQSPELFQRKQIRQLTGVNEAAQN